MTSISQFSLFASGMPRNNKFSLIRLSSRSSVLVYIIWFCVSKIFFKVLALFVSRFMSSFELFNLSSLSAWKKLESLTTHWAHSEDWSDWADAQADLSLRWAHSHFVGFVVRRLTFEVTREAGNWKLKSGGDRINSPLNGICWKSMPISVKLL